MKAFIFARRLFAGNWEEELERVLGIESETFYLLSDDALKAANRKADIIIFQTSLENRNGALNELKRLGYCEEDHPMAPAKALVRKLRDPENPNVNVPLIYTSIFAKGETAEEIAQEFGQYQNTYFFHELAPDGISPLVKEILGL